jgi:Flp pilus assembly protein TadB
VSLLCRWCQVREELLYAFEKCLETGLDEPVRSALREMTVRVRSGLSIEQALALMQDAVDHEHFHDLVAALRFNFRYRGDLPALLEQMEWQFNKIEEEYDRRRLSNARDRLLTVGILAAVPLFLLIRLCGSAECRAIFLDEAVGRILLVSGLLCYGLAILGFCLIQRRISG